MTHYRRWAGPFGEMLATEEDQAITGCYCIGQKYQPNIAPQWKEDPLSPLLLQLEEQLDDYSQHPEHEFALPLAPTGTAFQQSVWLALQQIPTGQTRYYQQLADSIGRPQSARSVAAAIGRNPILILIPCHRVIGKNGSLSGFAAGLELKQHLLHIENQAALTNAYSH